MSNPWRTTPTLEGKHVRLEPLTLDHAEGLFAATRDPEIWTWLLMPQPQTVEDMRNTIGAHLLGNSFLPFAQIDARTQEVAGTTSYYEIDPVHRSLTIGYTWVGTAWQRTSLNTEAKLLLLAYAFDTLGALRVAWQTDVRNERSHRAIERLGARREAILRQHRIRPDSTYRDTVIYSVIDSEWPDIAARLRARLVR